MNRTISTPNTFRGFSLMELLVALVVIGVLAGIATPMYQDHVRSGRRAAAQTALADIATRQEQFYLDNKTYTTALGSAGLNTRAVTDGDYYALSVDAATSSCAIANCYVLRAAPQASQAEDDCGTLTMTSQGDKSPSDCW